MGFPRGFYHQLSTLGITIANSIKLLLTWNDTKQYFIVYKVIRESDGSSKSKSENAKFRQFVVKLITQFRDTKASSEVLRQTPVWWCLSSGFCRLQCAADMTVTGPSVPLCCPSMTYAVGLSVMVMPEVCFIALVDTVLPGRWFLSRTGIMSAWIPHSLEASHHPGTQSLYILSSRGRIIQGMR